MELQPYPWQEPLWHRLLQQQRGERIAHAYLLAGERGLGKRHFAHAAAAFLLCEPAQLERACGQCRSCRLLIAGSNPDLLIVAPEDSKVVKVDQVRELTDFASKTSHSSARKVVILHNADSLNANAANALLKTLEEPPGSTVLLLIADNPGRLLPTVRSRCQRILFTAPDAQLVRAWLQERSASNDELEEALVLAGNRPLLALHLLESEDRQARGTVLTGLAAMLEGSLDPTDFAVAGKTLGAEKVLEWLWQITTLMLKQLLGIEQPAAGGKEVLHLYRLMSEASLAGDELLTRLLAMNRAAEEARLQLAGVSNPNGQLVLEGIMWRWSRLTH